VLFVIPSSYFIHLLKLFGIWNKRLFVQASLLTVAVFAAHLLPELLEPFEFTFNR